ncbi:MAG: hypothetical protein ACXWF1_00745, partial [Chthoniobacterales bacterium]
MVSNSGASEASIISDGETTIADRLLPSEKGTQIRRVLGGGQPAELSRHSTLNVQHPTSNAEDQLNVE